MPIFGGNATVAGITVIPNVRYVSVTGNNASAVAGRVDLPYATIVAAVNASVSGDVIIVLPGTHSMTGPAILKNGTHLTGFAGTVTKVIMDGSFPIQMTGGSGQNHHGAYLQPSPGISGKDRCDVSNLDIEVLMPPQFNGQFTAISGVNTATGTSVTGTGASYADMYFRDCRLKGTSDVHFVIDAVIRAYFIDCDIVTAFDFVHHLGPSNTAVTEFFNCRLQYIPFFDSVNFIGPTSFDSNFRIRCGTLRLKNCSLELVNDGLTNWSILGGSPISAYKGLQVDDFPGAVIEIIGGLPFRFTGAPWPNATPYCVFNTNTAIGTGTRGTVIVDGQVQGLCSYPGGFESSPVKIIPRSDMVISTEVFAGPAATNKSNAFRANAAAATQTFNMSTLAPGVVIKGVRLSTLQAFAGGAGTATTIEIGIPGNTTKYLPATTVRVIGNTLNTLNIMEGSGDPFTSYGTQLVITLRNTGANVSTLTAGSVVVAVELAPLNRY